jgi:hypothetical protein
MQPDFAVGAVMRATTTYYKFLSPSSLEPTPTLMSKIWRGRGDKKMDSRRKLDRGAMAAIGRELRVIYAYIVAEGAPEPFAEILHRLDEANNGDTRRDEPPLR